MPTITTSRPVRRGRVTRVAAVVAMALAGGACASTSSNDTTPPVSATTRPRPGATSRTASPPAADARYVLLATSSAGLDAYDPAPPFTAQRVVRSAADDPEGLDVDGPLCRFPDGSHRLLADLRTAPPGVEAPSAGVFALSGDVVGGLAAELQGSLAPGPPAAAGGGETVGCGFLADGRLVTSVRGTAADGSDGRLMVWFPPFGFEGNTSCTVAVGSAAIGDVVVDDEAIWVASAGPADGSGDAAGVYRYGQPAPAASAAELCGPTDAGTAPDRPPDPTRVIAAGADGLGAPTGLAAAPGGNLYVSSAPRGLINEYRRDGSFVRTVVDTRGGGAPGALAVGPDGTVFYADAGTAPPAGSVRRVRIVDGRPQEPELVAGGLTAPNGLGIWLPTATRR